MIAPVPPVPPQQSSADPSKPRVDLHLQANETTVDDKLAFEVELASYGEMRDLARTLKERLAHLLDHNHGTSHVFFLDDALRMALDLAPSIELQIKKLRDAFAAAEGAARSGLDLLTPTPPPAPSPLAVPRMPTAAPAVIPAAIPAIAIAAAPVIADAAVALIGALRADTRYTGRQVVIPEHAFALALGHQWEGSKTVEFHYPTLFVPHTAATTNVLARFAAGIDAAVAARSAAAHAVSDLLARVSVLNPTDVRFPAAKAALDAARDQLQAAEAVFEDTSVKMTRADETTGLTRLQLLVRAAFVTAIAQAAEGRTFYLFAQVVAAGGGFRTEKTVLRNDSAQHAGGCAATYGLFTDGGCLIASDTVGRRSAYQDSKPAILIE